MQNKTLQNKTKDKQEKIKQQKQNIEKFKQKYFDYYDDIKNPLRGREDW